MPDYNDHDVIISDLLPKAQDADKVYRDSSREQRAFLHVPNGMWEQGVWDSKSDQPRYTIDKTTPLIEETTGRIKKSDFGIKVQPVSDTADEDTAETLAGLIRNSSNMSGADHIFNEAVTQVVESGLNGWEVVNDFADPKSFHQDLLFKPVTNWIDRVWFDHASLSRTPIDARHAFKLTSFALDEYKEKWPKGSGMSVSQDKLTTTVEKSTDDVVVGQVYYLKETDVVLILMTNGSVYEDDAKFHQIKDELALEGIAEDTRRTAKVKRQWIRQFDGKGWLKDAEETPFELISLCPEYGKFSVIDDVITYRGMTLKQMDMQRIYNYTRSRQIGEGALAPRAKYWMTPKQADGFADTLATMNTNNDPVQFYNPDPENPGIPQQNGGAQINPGLEIIAASMTQDMQEVANKFSVATPGQMNARSGVVIDELKESSDTGDIDWTEGHEIALCYTFKVWLTGARHVYDGTRTSRILGENGEFSMEALNTTRLDRQTQEMVTINDLSTGIYDVVCSAGKSYKSRQGETISNILEIGAVDPNVIMEGEDILVNASDGPGMKDIAERIRARKIKEGSIPQSQWTEEENQQAQAAAEAQANQPPQPDPVTMAAQGALLEGQAALQDSQNKQQEIQGNQQIKMIELQQAQEKLDLSKQEVQLDVAKFQRENDDKFNVNAAKISQGQQKLDQDGQAQQFNAFLDQQKQQQQQFNDTFNNLKTLTDAMQTFVGPHLVEAGINQAVAITDEQKEQGFDTGTGEAITGTALNNQDDLNPNV